MRFTGATLGREPGAGVAGRGEGDLLNHLEPEASRDS